MKQEMSFVPVLVEIQKEQGMLKIQWDDGHEGTYDVRYLRGNCPCAECQGHGGGRRFVNVPGPMIVSIEPVGNYALKISWDDADGRGSHNTGIYTFDYLRELCPCSGCRKAKGSEHPINKIPPDYLT